MATVGGVPVHPDAQAKVNGIVEQDNAKGRVPVHNFDPDASPQEKAAAAGKNTQKLGLENGDIKSGAQGMSSSAFAACPPPYSLRAVALGAESNALAAPQRYPSTRVPGAV